MFLIFTYLVFVFVSYIIDRTKKGLENITDKHDDKQNDTAKHKTELPGALLVPLETEMSVIFRARVKLAFASLKTVVHLRWLLPYLLTDGVGNLVVKNLRHSAIDVILRDVRRVVLALAGPEYITCICEAD